MSHNIVHKGKSERKTQIKEKNVNLIFSYQWAWWNPVKVQKYKEKYSHKKWLKNSHGKLNYYHTFITFMLKKTMRDFSSEPRVVEKAVDDSYS